tara:strand:+ start:1421 stop:1657 length:237 start_codon:yes stop_codon:yes gene_type:complete
MSDQLCECNHEPIIYIGQVCPLCKSKEEIDYLTKKLEILRGTIVELNRFIESNDVDAVPPFALPIGRRGGVAAINNKT